MKEPDGVPGDQTPDRSDAAKPVDPTTVHLHAAVDGDADSLGWLFQRLAPLLLVQARFRLRNRIGGVYAAEDLLQDTWLTALSDHRLQRLQPRDGRLTPVLVKFLSSVMNNLVRNLMRRDVQRRRSGQALGSAVERVVDPTRGVASNVCAQSVSEEVDRAIKELSPLEQSVIVMRGIERQPPRDIAPALGISANHVSVTCRRAVEKLRHKLDPELLNALS